MALLWVEAVKEPYDPEESHDWHRLHPAFAAAGIRPSPCTHLGCDQYDADHDDAFTRAEKIHWDNTRRGTPTPIEHIDPSADPIHGLEPSAFPSRIRQYIHDPDSRSAGLPLAFRHRGDLHLMDGHHGTAAALHRGDNPIAMHVINLDQEG